MNIHELNKILEELLSLNEMATLNNVIEVNNEDVTNTKGVTQEKFAHFHWVYNHNIHFKFSNRIPKNIEELKQLVAFKDDLKQISGSELKQVLKELNKVVQKGKYKGMIVFDAAKELWGFLHPKRKIDSELIIL